MEKNIRAKFFGYYGWWVEWHSSIADIKTRAMSMNVGWEIL